MDDDFFKYLWYFYFFLGIVIGFGIKKKIGFLLLKYIYYSERDKGGDK